MVTAKQKAAPSTVPTAARVTALVLFVLCTAIMVGKFLHHDYKDAEVWYDVGRRVLTGQPILHLVHYRYPPTFAVLIAPLCLLPWPAFFLTCYGLNIVFFALSARLALRLAWPGDAPRPRHLSWAPLALCLAYFVDNLFLGQTNLLVMALFFGSMAELTRGREGRAGLLLAVTVAIKVFTLPWVAYLLLRGHFRAVAATLVATVALLLLIPAPFRGFSRNLAETADWGARVVAPYLQKGEAGDWGAHGLDYGNQSLQAVLHRLLSRVDANVLAREEPPLYVNLLDLSEGQVNLILLVALALLAGGFVWACGWRRPRSPQLLGVELALSTILLLLVSAIAWTYFYVMLLLPFATAFALLAFPPAIRPNTRRLLVAALWLQGLVVPLMGRMLAGPLFRAAGSICWAALLLALALALAARDLRRASPPPAPE